MVRKNKNNEKAVARSVRNAREFEDMCREIVTLWYKKNKPNKQVIIKSSQNNLPIDIIVKEIIDDKNESFCPGIGSFISSSKENEYRNSHFIECKFYSKKLSLDVISKSILVTMCFRPKKFTLASNSPLDNQAAFYFEIISSNFDNFKDIDFGIWNPLVDEISSSKNVKDAIDIHKTISFYKIKNPVIYLNKDIYYNNKLKPSLIKIKDEDMIIFCADLIHPDNPYYMRKIDCTLNLIDSTYSHEFNVVFEIERDKKNRKDSIKAIFKPSDLLRGLTYDRWSLAISAPGFEETHLFSKIAAVMRCKTPAVFPDLRKDETDAVYDQWNKSELPLLLLSGPCGIGKSFLGEQLCLRLHEEKYSCVTVCLSSESDQGFIADLVWASFGSLMKRILYGNKSVIETFSKTLEFLFEEERIQPDILKAIERLLTDGYFESDHLEVVLSNLARIITRRSNVVLYVRDLHLGTPEVITCLRHLIRGFDRAGWGRVKVILEQREGGPKNPFPEPLELRKSHNLPAWVKTYLSTGILEKKLEKIPGKDLASRMEPIFSSGDSREVASQLAARCNGNLFFLDTMVRQLLQEGIIAPLSPAQPCRDFRSFSIPSLPLFSRRLRSLSGDECDAIETRLQQLHDQLIQSGRSAGCFWLALLVVIDMEASAALLARLTGKDADTEIVPALSFFMSEGILDQRENLVFFSHETIQDVVRSRFLPRSDATLWLQDNATYGFIPVHFDESLARGRIWAHLHQSDRAIDAFNAALSFSRDNFSRRFRCLGELHRIFFKERSARWYHEFFDTLSKLLWCGQYVLSKEESLEILHESLIFLDGIDGPEDIDSSCVAKRFSLHHTASWFHIVMMNLEGYFANAYKAMDYARSAHDLAIMLNRLLMVCAITGDRHTGRQAGLLTCALAFVIPAEEDKDLLSVNLGEFSFVEALSSKDDALRLASMACENRHASTRQRAHDLYALGRACTRSGDVDRAREALDEAGTIASSLEMQSMKPGIDLCRGVLLAREMALGAARTCFERALSEAAWLGRHREVLMAGQNLLLALVVDEDHDRMEPILASVSGALRCCNADFSPARCSELFERLSEKVDHILQAGTSNDEKHPRSLHEAMESSARKLDLSRNVTREQISTTTDIIHHNLHTLSTRHPLIYEWVEKTASFDNSTQKKRPRIGPDAISWTINPDLTLYLVC